MVKKIYVEWIDSLSGDSLWHLIDDVDDLSPLHIMTFGFLIKDCDDYIVVAQNYSKDIPQYCNVITIPKCSIIKTTEIK